MLSTEPDPGLEILELVNKARVLLGRPTLLKLPRGVPETSRKCVLGRSLEVEILLDDQDRAYALILHYRTACRLAHAWRVERPCGMWSGWAVLLPEQLNKFVHEFDARCYPKLSSIGCGSENGIPAGAQDLRFDWVAANNQVANLIERARRACHQTQKLRSIVGRSSQ
jgi:hypothetical protein